eukprot:scaffold45017_cov30-Tisochrysis_lutea.AAC.1
MIEAPAEERAAAEDEGAAEPEMAAAEEEEQEEESKPLQEPKAPSLAIGAEGREKEKGGAYAVRSASRSSKRRERGSSAEGRCAKACVRASWVRRRRSEAEGETQTRVIDQEEGEGDGI